MNEQIKKLIEEASRLHKQALDILAEFKGKDMPKDKATQVDKLLDDVEAKTQEKTRLERAEGQGRYLNTPVTGKAFYQDKEGDGKPRTVKWGGREYDPADLTEFKSMVPFPAYLDFGNGEHAIYGKSFRAYLRKGLSGLMPEEEKVLSAGEAPAGGYLVQDTHLNELITGSRSVSAMRRISRVLPMVASGAVIVPSEDSIFSDPEWTSEILSGSLDTVKPFGERRLNPKPLAKRVRVTNTFLRTPTFDVEAYVRERLAYKFGVAEENAFVNGDGVGKPLGILKTPSLPTFTSVTADNIYGNDVINWVYALPAAYAARARILCNRAFVRKIRVLSTASTGVAFTNYIWQPGLAAGIPNTILDVPYDFSDQMDDALSVADAWETDGIAAVIGDWSFYWIVDAIGLSIQRLVELYAESNQTGYIGRKEADGACVLAEAFYALKVA